MTVSCDARHVIGSRAAVDNTTWDGGAAMSNCAGAEDPAPCYGSICAGKKAGDDSKQSSWALPHHKAPGDPPNAAGVRNALARLPQTQGLTNKAAAQAHLEAHMKAISPDSQDSAHIHGEQRAMNAWDPDNDGDDDSTAAGDTDHSHWDEAGNPIVAQWLADGRTPPEGSTEVLLTDDETDGNPGMVGVGPSTSAGYGGLNSKAPRDNLVRAMGDGFAVRSDDAAASPSEFYGSFSRFNQWYPVDSIWEGSFMERVLPGAFVDTIANDKASMRVLYDHGMDPAIGNKPLGPIRTLREDPDGPYFDGPFLDTDYNRDFVIPALTGRLMDGSHAGSQLGSSFRFQVQEDKWNMRPKADRNNPDALPERSIVKAKVFEFGPVTFPANSGATASARSLSDEWMAKLIGDTRFQQQFADRIGGKVAERFLASVPAEVQQEILHQRRTSQADVLRRRARALLAFSA